MSWGNVPREDRASEKQVKYANKLMIRAYGDIVKDVAVMTVREASSFIDELNRELEAHVEPPLRPPERNGVFGIGQVELQPFINIDANRVTMPATVRAAIEQQRRFNQRVEEALYNSLVMPRNIGRAAAVNDAQTLTIDDLARVTELIRNMPEPVSLPVHRLEWDEGDELARQIVNGIGIELQAQRIPVRAISMRRNPDPLAMSHEYKLRIRYYINNGGAMLEDRVFGMMISEQLVNDYNPRELFQHIIREVNRQIQRDVSNEQQGIIPDVEYPLGDGSARIIAQTLKAELSARGISLRRISCLPDTPNNSLRLMISYYARSGYERGFAMSIERRALMADESIAIEHIVTEALRQIERNL